MTKVRSLQSVGGSSLLELQEAGVLAVALIDPACSAISDHCTLIPGQNVSSSFSLSFPPSSS